MSIEFRNVGYTYLKDSPFENNVLNNINFNIKKGEIVSLIGHTGSGKSTIIQIMDLLLLDFSGEVIVDGCSSLDKKVRKTTIRKKIGVSFQHPEYQFFEETIYKDIAFSLKIRRETEENIYKRVKLVMEMVGLDFYKYKDRNPFNISGGEKRKVSIASALVLDPDYLILDEPMVGLDPKTREDIFTIIENLNKKFSKTIIMVSHIMDVVYRLSTKVILISKGRIIREGTPIEIFNDKDILDECFVEQPYIVKFQNMLKEKGIYIKNNPKSILELKREIVSYLENKREST